MVDERREREEVANGKLNQNDECRNQWAKTQDEKIHRHVDYLLEQHVLVFCN